MIFQSPSTAPVDAASDSITVDAWIMVALTALTFLFALWSWWSANKSGKARKAAEKAEANADRRVEAAESTATELRKLVERLSLPPLKATTVALKTGRKVMLTNTTGEEITLVELVNSDKFYAVRPLEPFPITIHQGAQTSISVFGSAQIPRQENLHLRLFSSGEERLLHVPIPHVI